MIALAFDLGTSYLKAGLFGPDLKPLAIARRPTPVTRPRPGRSEIDPPAFLAALRELAAALRSQAPAEWTKIERISFATQANSVVLLDASDRPLTPTILWNDARALELDDLRERLVELHPPGTYAQTGLAALNEQFMPARLLWLHRREPDIWQRTARVCLISDFLTLWLTGRHTTEGSVAGLSGLLDIHRLAWRESAIEAIGLAPRQLPTPLRAGTEIGPVTGVAAAELQLAGPATVMAGCLDQYAGAIGAGGLEPGTVTDTTGTVLAAVAYADRFDPALEAAGIIQGPAPHPGHWFRLCFTEVSAAMLEAYRDSCAGRPDFESLDAESAQLPREADVVRVDVERWLAKRELRFTGATAPTRGQAVRAIQRAVAEALAQLVRRLAPDARQIRAAGGVAGSRTWLAIKSEIVGLPVLPAPAPEPTTRGAAVLALGLNRQGRQA